MTFHNTGLTTHANVKNISSPLSDDRLRELAPSIFATGAHESRSERFAHVATSEIVTALRAEGFQPYEAKQGKSRIPGKADFTKHLIRFRHEAVKRDRADLKLGDLFPEVVLLNAHDGTSRYKLMGGIMRCVCLNGNIVADSLFASINISHTRKAVENIIEGSYRVIKDADKMLDAPRKWSGIYLTQEDRRQFAIDAMKLRFGVDAEGNPDSPVDALRILDPKREEDRHNDLWTIFSIAQENGIRGGLSGRRVDAGTGKRRRVTTRAINAIDATVEYNRDLWTLAENTAKQLQSA